MFFLICYTGCGFIGRHLLEYLIENNLASEIRVVDKIPSQLAWLNTQHTKSFQNPIVEFCSANLINPVSCKTAFAPAADGSSWDFVINCAAETRYGQTDPIYKEGILKLSINCANESARQKVKRYIELSSGNMCSNEKTSQKEDCSKEPWTLLAKYKAKVEKELKEIPDLKYTILRLPVVYGRGDRKGLTPRILIASLYKDLNEPMKLLWTSSMKLNTVHVEDVVSSIWYLGNLETAINQTYNIVDDSNSTQGSISDILADLFNIKVDYWGVMMSSITKIDMSGVVEEINDKHMGPWAEFCSRDHIENTPLTPYMDEELLYHKHLNLDNSKLKSSGYELRVPSLNREKIEEIINDFEIQGIFPRGLAGL